MKGKTIRLINILINILVTLGIAYIAYLWEEYRRSDLLSGQSLRRPLMEAFFIMEQLLRRFGK